MMNNGYNFTNHYSFYTGGGSTFNSEFAVNTGFITPLSYTQNAYTFLILKKLREGRYALSFL